MNFFLNGEILCFTILSNFWKKCICQILRRKASLEKSDLYVERRINFAFLTHSIRVSAYRYVERRWYVVDWMVGVQWENYEVKRIMPVILSYMYEFMDDVFDKLKKACLDPVWLLDDQKLIPTFLSKVKNSFWRFRKSGSVKTWKRVRQTRSTSSWIKTMWYLACIP